ncbi:MAG: ArnT family glycosyltransferase [Actinomycetota bacterium]
MSILPTRQIPKKASRLDRSPYRVAVGLFALVGATFVGESIQHHAGPLQAWPLYALWEPSIGPRIFLVCAIAAVGWFLKRAALRVRRSVFLTMIVAFTWTFALVVAIQGSSVKTESGCCARGGAPAEITAPFRDSDSYFANVALVDRLGPKEFAEDYSTLDQPPYTKLSIHALTHPPGAPLLLWASDEAVGENLLGVCLLMMLLGALSSVATYLIALELHGERAARLAGLLFCVAPAVVLYLATSMDAVFMTGIAFCFAALVRGLRSDKWAFVAGVLFALALMLTFSALAIVLVAFGLAAVWGREISSAELARRGTFLLLGLAGGLGGFWLALGVDMPGVWAATTAAHATLASTYRPYLYWVWANLVTFFIVAGIPQAALMAWEVRIRWRSRTPGLETVTLVTLLLLTVSNVFKGEVDHIWLFMVPLVAVSAGAGLDHLTADNESRELARALGWSAFQAVAMQALLFTYW